MKALQDPGDLGQQVRPPGRQLAQPGHRGRMPGPGKLPPPRVMPRLTHKLSDEDTVGLRTIIDHRFYCHTELSNPPPRGSGAGSADVHEELPELLIGVENAVLGQVPGRLRPDVRLGLLTGRPSTGSR